MSYQTHHLLIINQLFELDKKITRLADGSTLQRPVARIWDQFTEMGYTVANPLGEAYIDTRTDCEASIAGENIANLRIQTVLKPVVYWQSETGRQLVQKAVVVVQSAP